MPKFYKQNKKRIDPRYFLHETVDETLEEESLDEIAGDGAEEKDPLKGCTFHKPRKHVEEFSATYKGVSCGCRESDKADACRKAKAKWKAKQGG